MLWRTSRLLNESRKVSRYGLEMESKERAGEVMLRLFIGYDSRETLAYHVLVHSILRHTKVPVSITPLKLDQLAMYSRQRGPTEATEFSMTRFLVPYLCAFEREAIYM